MDTSQNINMLEKAMSYSPDVICAIDPQGNLRYGNAAFQRVLGYGNELLGMPFVQVVYPDDRPMVLANCARARQQAEPVQFDSRCLCRAGQERTFAWSVFGAPGGELLLCVGRDVTAERRTAQQAQQQAVLHQAFIGHGFDMVALLNEEGIYSYVGGSTSKALGYSPEQLVGRSAFDFIHPDDLERVQAYWARLSSQPIITVPDFRFRDASGEWKWIETTVSNQLQNPAIRAYAVSSRDITERKQSGCELAQSEQRLRLLFENNPSLAVFQDTQGLILDANPAFLAFLKRSKPEVVNRQLVDFLPEEVRPLFNQKFQEALSGRHVRFEVSVQDEDGENRILNVTKVPLVVEGKTTGVHVTAKDITEIATAQRLIKRQTEQLTTILESITDAFFSLDKNWNFTYINSEAERILNIGRQKWLGKSIWDCFPNAVGGIFHQHYKQALETGETVHFEAFSSYTNLWLDIKAFPFQGGLSVYFSDVTDRVGASQQLKLLAQVARGTDNGVVITDAEGRTEWVNEGFTRHTGYSQADMAGKKPGAVLQGPETDPAAIQRFRERMKHRAPFSVTILNYKKSGQKLWLSMDITSIYDDAGERTHFVAIMQNINYRKEIEASQAKMTQDLYRHNRDLQQFTYVISHNLRAPLANALGLTTLLTKVGKNTEAFDVSLAHLGKSMEQVDTVLKDLNMVLSIRDKQDMMEQEMVLLIEVGRQALLNLAEPLRECNGQVKLDIEDGLAVRGNRAYLYSIFYNLLSNSIKYRSEERTLQVEIKALVGEQGGISISFTDNGSGFDMFKAGSDVFQLYKRFHTNQRGRGIGLFLVKTHVEAMGGKIEVASGVNFGTRFLIHLDKR
jgi:PAS domain S-box-containing protein